MLIHGGEVYAGIKSLDITAYPLMGKVEDKTNVAGIVEEGDGVEKVCIPTALLDPVVPVDGPQEGECDHGKEVEGKDDGAAEEGRSGEPEEDEEEDRIGESRVRLKDRLDSHEEC